MAETVVVTQGKQYLTSYQAGESEQAPAELRAVRHLHELTPYGMVLAGLGACTALVVNTYAEHHGLSVDAVVITLEYRRSFEHDCEHCEEIDTPEEQILMAVAVEGALSPQQREKLFAVALHCPVHRMLTSGIKVTAKPA